MNGNALAIANHVESTKDCSSRGIALKTGVPVDLVDKGSRSGNAGNGARTSPAANTAYRMGVIEDEMCVRNLDKPWRPTGEGHKMGQAMHLEEISTDSWVRMVWLTRIRGYRVRRLAEKPCQGMLGNIHYVTHWWLAQQGRR